MAGALHFAGDLVQPLRAALADVAGFGHDHRQAVAFPGLAQQRGEGPSPRIVQVPVEALLGFHLPLPVVVVVDAEHVQPLRRTAQLRVLAAGEHVPRLPLVAAHLLGEGSELGAPRRRNHVHQRFDVQEPGPRQDVTHRLHGREARAHEVALDLIAARARVACLRPTSGTHQAALGQRPRKKVDLVDRGDDRGFFAETAQLLSHGRGEAREARHPGALAQVHVVRGAVVHQRPQHLQAVPASGRGRQTQTLKVVAAGRRFGQAPSDALAHRA